MNPAWPNQVRQTNYWFARSDPNSRVILPHIIDQFYWGQQVFQAGAGPRYISRGKLTEQNLAAALTTALTDAAMRARAADLGHKIRSAPDGVKQAVQIISGL